MKKMACFVVFGLLLTVGVGCATVKVQAPKEPIKLDVTMRLDVYQHVQKDIDAIENIVTGVGTTSAQPVVGPLGFLERLETTAYAEELDAEVQNAAFGRRARYQELMSLEKSGVIGENRSGLVVVKKASGDAAAKLVRDENRDRMVIYEGIADKNGTSVEDVQKVYAERLQKDAPQGTPIESQSGTWSVK